MSELRTYMYTHEIDAHLLVVQLCRVTLTVSGILTLAVAVGSSAETTQRYRLQCATTGTACLVTSRYYTRLYTLRRLPLGLGYSLEGNTVAESMRYANWSVVIGLLTWCAFLLRGPFENDEGLTGGDSTYRAFSWWTWSYSFWIGAGPLLSSGTTMLGLPGWHAARSSREAQKRGAYREAVVWFLAFFLLLGISASVSVVIGLAMIAEGDGTRPSRELDLSRFISMLWFVYPVVSCVRTTSLVFGIGSLQGSSVIGEGGAAGINVEPSAVRPVVAQGMAHRVWSTASAGIGVVASVVKAVYLAMVAAPSTGSALVVARLSATAEGLANVSAEKALLRSFATSSSTIRAPVIGVEGDTDEEVREPLLVPDASALLDWTVAPVRQQALAKLPADMARLHRPEVSPLCAQGVDSIIALVDIFSQGLAALGTVYITIDF